MDNNHEVLDDDFLFYSLLYSSITVLFAMAVLSKFLTNEFRFGFRSILSLGILFIGEPLCHFLLKGPSGVAMFGVGCLLVYSILPASHLPVGNKAVLVTGKWCQIELHDIDKHEAWDHNYISYTYYSISITIRGSRGMCVCVWGGGAGVFDWSFLFYKADGKL